MKKDLTETLAELRTLFASLTPAQQLAEATRLYRSAKGLPIYYLEPINSNEALKFNTIQEVMEYLTKQGVRPNKSNINKVINGQRKQAYGYRFIAVYDKEK